MSDATSARAEAIKAEYPEKFLSEPMIFRHIRRGDRIFIGTGCGEPQYLVRALVAYLKSSPRPFFDTEILHVWKLGVAPYADDKYKRHFRYNSFFVGNSTRDSVNIGNADYSPIFLSQVPEMFNDKSIPIDVALVQTTYPDEHGFLRLGVSVDITKVAVDNASLVIAQMNSHMPEVQGDGFVHIDDVDYLIHHDEPLLEYRPKLDDEVAARIGAYVSRLVRDGDTIQVGYGSLPNAILNHLGNKQHLGVHTELLTDGIVNLMQNGIVDNTRKTIDRGRTIAAFCMGSQPTYEFLRNNPTVELRTIDYTNSPLVLSQHHNFVAINSALEIDLTGQATAESIGSVFYSGIGGQADFMRGATWAPRGETILTLPSTARDGTVSRIVPFLKEGAGVTLNRGDVRFVVTEYGIAYLKGKSIRERATELISIAHPDFREWLIDEAKSRALIYRDQKYIPGTGGQDPEHLEAYRTTKTGTEILLRPVKISDEPLLKRFFHGLSDHSMELRFFSTRPDIPHDFLQSFTAIDYTREMVLLAVERQSGRDAVVGIGQYWLRESEDSNYAYLGFAVRDDMKNRGIGNELLKQLIFLARRQGIHGFVAEILAENGPMLHLIQKPGIATRKTLKSGVYSVVMDFRG